MNVLVACEESQRVCIAFREKGHNAFSCDILPCLGDDFPAVLRQMKANMRSIKDKSEKVLVIDEFTATGATYEQVQKMFKLSEISLFRFSDFE